MIPYFSLPPITIGGIEFYWFMLLIVVGIAAGTEYARARAIREDLSVKITVDCTLFMVLMGFLVAHFVSIIFYFPERLAEDWKKILPWYDFSISSMGGYLGAAIAIPLFLKVWKKVPVWAYTDTLAFGVTLGFFFGRVGCFTAHDHVGSPTNFFLGVRFPDRFTNVAGEAYGIRHDLGLYEALVLLLIFVAMVLLDRHKQWFHGFFSGLLLVLYAPARLFLDSLRAEDLARSDRRFRPGDILTNIRDWVGDGGHSAVERMEALQKGRDTAEQWPGLTFAQYGAIALFLFGVWVLFSRHDKGQQDISAELDRDRRPAGRARSGLLGWWGRSEQAPDTESPAVENRDETAESEDTEDSGAADPEVGQETDTEQDQPTESNQDTDEG
ncbi:MAG: prolipoprotein diacylglyceryl transferase family protein [Myxococcota bacterium]|nr:prolipoprotein diacylglyceryl transferase family protein [Myxococcota bacterium]